MTARNFVLVHGAWRGGWCFARVAERLRAAGHRVFTPTLSGLGERAHAGKNAPADFTAHVADIAAVLRFERLDRIVLCGHSYGGLVAAAVADAAPDRIAALVFLDALLPDGEKSVLGTSTSNDVVAAMLQAAADTGGRTIPPFPAAMFGVNQADADMVDALCTPHPLPSFCEPIALTGAWHAVPRKTYVRATGWAGYGALGFDPPALIPGDGSWRQEALDCGHEIMLDAPDATAAFLLGA